MITYTTLSKITLEDITYLCKPACKYTPSFLCDLQKPMRF